MPAESPVQILFSLSYPLDPEMGYLVVLSLSPPRNPPFFRHFVIRNLSVHVQIRTLSSDFRIVDSEVVSSNILNDLNSSFRIFIYPLTFLCCRHDGIVTSKFLYRLIKIG